MNNLYFVDFENLQKFSYEKIDPENDMVVIFTGHTQTKISLDIIKKTQRLGKSVEWIQMSGSGRNSLDFHIAYYLGYFIASKETTGTKCNVFVASKDADYDILIKHIQDQGHHCERITHILTEAAVNIEDKSKSENAASIKESTTVQSVANKELSHSEIFEHLTETLGKVEKLKRPRTIKTLTNHISAHYQKKKSNLSPEAIVNLLKANKKITISDQRISYRF